jgi:hypothetical protein
MIKNVPKTQFYLFLQNNSGGEFILNDNLAEMVWIESSDSTTANTEAESFGIYFNGVRRKIDCECCGDRWNRVSTGPMYIRPMLGFDTTPDRAAEHDVIVHFADGRKGFAAGRYKILY